MRRMPVERRYDITRLEGFSDAVFGFALTLLVVSLDVPRSYEQLMDLMRGFPSFACCFALLLWLWHEHNVFFRRYGLQDGVTVVLNGGLLFMVLLYVYPLKFMFDSLFARFMPTSHPPVQMQLYQLANASSVYAAGFILMMLMFVLLYTRAYAKRKELGLTELETFDLKALRGHHIVSVSVGFVALAVATVAPLVFVPFSPMMFGLLGPGHGLWAARHGKQRKALERQLAGPAAAPVS
jgi:uncharacterized membrane protein